MASLSEFYDAPFEGFLGGCTKEQLFQIAGHYAIEVDEKKRKGEVRDIVLSALREMGVFGAGETSSDIATLGVPVSARVSISGPELTFEQRKELMMLQIEQDKLRFQAERELRMLDLEKYQLSLVHEGRLSAVDGAGSFDVGRNLRLVPEFNERDPDTFFYLV